MADLVDYKVVREHQGDKLTDDGFVVHRFMPGETRTADPSIVAHLIPNTLSPPPEAKTKGKAEKDAPENKAEPGAPQNKAGSAPVAKTKGK